MYETDFDLKHNPEIPTKFQQIARQATLDLNQERLQQRQALFRQIKQLRPKFLKEFYSIIGDENLDYYHEFRSKSKQRLLSKTLTAVESDTQIEEERKQLAAEYKAFLASIGVDRNHVTQLQREYMENIHKLFGTDQLERSDDALLLVELPPYDRGSSSWVTYNPPYAGYFWSYSWDRSDEPDDPFLERYLDQNNGQIGSVISTLLSGADNDDWLSASYFTALKLWHQVSVTGPLEVYLAIRFLKSTYSGLIVDEFGFSDITFNQWASSQMNALAPDGRWDRQSNNMFNRLGVVRGEGSIFETKWDKQVSAPNDIHMYYFRTDRSFSAGSWLLLEAAILNVIWFWSDDESISTVTNLDLRLDRVAVRTII